MASDNQPDREGREEAPTALEFRPRARRRRMRYARLRGVPAGDLDEVIRRALDYGALELHPCPNPELRAYCRVTPLTGGGFDDPAYAVKIEAPVLPTLVVGVRNGRVTSFAALGVRRGALLRRRITRLAQRVRDWM